MTNKLPEIIEPKFEQIISDALGAEGPVFSTDQLFMVAPEVEIDGKPAGQVLKVEPDSGKKSVLVSPKVDRNGGIPAGCMSDKDGNLWIADMRLGLITVNIVDGSVKQIAVQDSEGRGMQGCNDCVFDYNGNLWITAPAGPIAPAPYTRSSKENPFGSVYCHTASGETVLVDTGYSFSNGIAVQHTKAGKPELLIVAETATKTFWAYDITGPAKVSNKRVWGRLPGDNDGGPDGMDFDERNRLLVAHWGSGFIEVFDPTGGAPVQRIACPFTRVSNLHFQPGSSLVYVTEHDSHALWSFRWECNGRKHYCEL